MKPEMDNSKLTEWLNNSVKSKSHDVFKNVVKISDINVQNMGDGTVMVISDIRRVILTLETSDGQKKILKAIAKFESEAGAGKDFADFVDAFGIETTMYSEVLKTMESMLSEVGDNDLPWADCYHCGDNKFLFQDLCEDNYRIVPIHVLLDREHTLLVMKALGKFHALSLLMKEKNILRGERFKRPVFACDAQLMKSVYMSTLENLFKTVKASWGPEWETVPDRLKNYFGDPREKIYKVWLDTKGKWDVLNHGDFTIRNMLFHYPPGSTHPDGVKFVDFQTCHYGNFAFDLGQLLYSSLLPSVRDKNMSDFLNAYTDSMAQTCTKFRYNGSIPTVEDVDISLKSVHLFTTITVLFNLPFAISPNQQGIQEKVTAFFEKMSSTDATEKPHDESMVDYTSKQVQELIQSELKRCMKQNIL